MPTPDGILTDDSSPGPATSTLRPRSDSPVVSTRQAWHVAPPPNQPQSLSVVVVVLVGVVVAVPWRHAVLEVWVLADRDLTCVLGYRVAALPLAAAGLLNPTLVGLAMALSSVAAVANSLRLRRFSQQPPSFEDLE